MSNVLENFVSAWNDLQKEIHDNAKEKGWWEKERNDGELLALIHSEISEALEGLRAGNPPDDKVPQHSSAAVELADAIVRIMDMAQARGWDVAQALVDKVAYNKTRAYRHGGKKF